MKFRSLRLPAIAAFIPLHRCYLPDRGGLGPAFFFGARHA
jgi:hypothetical protein